MYVEQNVQEFGSSTHDMHLHNNVEYTYFV
jgi:hypothetical protein